MIVFDSWKCALTAIKMYRINSALTNAKQKDFLLLTLFLKRIFKTQVIETRHVTTVASPSQDESLAKPLPTLPVQPLEQMLEKYMKSIKPFVNTTELEKTKKLLEAFCSHDASGKKLQRLLEERARSTENWLADWWLQTAYLEYRDPVPIFSSPALVWPKRKFKTQQEQLQFAAQVIKYALDFNEKIEKKELPQDQLGGQPLCMNQYYKIFGTCRIPKMPRDELIYQDPLNLSRNIIVMYNNHVFSIPAFPTNTRKPFTAPEFYSMLLEVVNKGDELPGIPIGILTTENRDNWAKSYEELKKNSTNKEILEKYIEKSLFVVCIDKPSLSTSSHYNTRCSQLLLHGFGMVNFAGNRWFDKTIQFVIGAGEDGVGIVYEHSPAEGGPIAVLTDFINSSINIDDKLKAVPDCPKPEKLEFIESKTIISNILSATSAFSKLSTDLEVHGLSFDGFGKDEIKNLKASPDSFIQVAIQLAFFKVHNRVAAQYESGSLRKFLYGRTDTIRSCSEEVANFCKTFTNPRAKVTEISTALRRAIDSHKSAAVDVVEGRGVDRHLLGLKILAKLHDVQVPELFADAAYKRSTYFQLSTSNVATKCDAFMIYGPLVKDGYACCYNPRKNSINFGLSAWCSCKDTDLDAFKRNLEDALTSMRHCLLSSLKSSKL